MPRSTSSPGGFRQKELDLQITGRIERGVEQILGSSDSSANTASVANT